MKEFFIIVLFISLILVFTYCSRAKISKKNKATIFRGAIPKYCLLNYYFDEVICISTTNEKKAKMKKIFKQWGLKVKFYNSNTFDEKSFKKGKNILVFRDTLLLSEKPENPDDFNRRIFYYLINLPNDWDLINFCPKWEMIRNNISNKYFQKTSYLPKSSVFAINENISDYINKPIIDRKNLKIYSTSHIIF